MSPFLHALLVLAERGSVTSVNVGPTKVGLGMNTEPPCVADSSERGHMTSYSSMQTTSAVTSSRVLRTALSAAVMSTRTLTG